MRSFASARTQTGGLLSGLLSALFVILIALVAGTSALTEQVAFGFDSYIPRLGIPATSPASSLSINPRYHRIITHASDTVEPGKAQTALFSVSETGVIGALNPRNGQIVWRQQLDEQVQGFWLDANQLIVVSGSSGEKIQAFEALTGFLSWSRQLLPPGTGRLINDDRLNVTSVSQREALPASDVIFIPSMSAPRYDNVILNDGDTVRRFDAETGVLKWKFSRRDNGEDSASSPSIRVLATSSTHVHLLSLVPATASTFGLQHQVLAAANGALLYTANLPGVSIERSRGAADVSTFALNTPADQTASSTSPPEPHVVWRQADGSIQSLPLALPPLEKERAAKFVAKKQSPQVVRDADRFIALRSVGLGEHGFAIGMQASGKAQVISLKATPGKGRELVTMWQFEEMAQDAVYSSSFDRAGSPYINRVYFQNSQLLLNFHVFWTKTQVEDEGQVTGFSFRWDHDMHGDVLAAPFEVNPVNPFQVITRAALVTVSGSYRMIQEDRHHWINEESAVQTEHVTFVDLPVRASPSGSDVTSEDALRLLQLEGPIGRLVRHAKALTNVPQAFVDTARGILDSYSTRGKTVDSSADPVKGAAAAAATGIQALSAGNDGLPLPRPTQAGNPARAISRAAPPPTKSITGTGKRAKTPPPKDEVVIDSVAPRIAEANTTANLYSDKWGLRQLMISSTKTGKLYAQDTGLKAQYVWEKSLMGYGEGAGAPVPPLSVKYLGLVREPRMQNGQHISPLVYIVAETTDAQTGVKATVIWELDPLTGSFVDEAITGRPLFLGSTVEARKLKGEETLAVVDERYQLNLWPQTAKTAREANRALALLPFWYTEVSSSKDQLTGYSTPASFTPSNVIKLSQSWSWKLPEGEKVVSTHTSSSLTDAPIASLSKEINDWFLSKMPKLLDPAMLIVVTYDEVKASLSVHLIDQSTGAVLSTVKAPYAGQVDFSRGVHVAFVENWLTLGYSVQNDQEGLGGRLLSVEYYDSNPTLERSLANWFTKSMNPRADINSKDAKARGKAILPRAKQVKAYFKSFVTPSAWEGIQSLAVSETVYNAADRALLLLGGNQEIMSIPRKFLDPRRPLPKGSPLLLQAGKQSRQEADSMLPPYDPILPDDEKRVLTHGHQIFTSNQGPRAGGGDLPSPRLLSRRTKLESTTLVISIIGTIDTFVTKLNTAGGDFDLLSGTFNKVQLIGTTMLLGLGIAVTKPLVKGKSMKQRWA